MPESDAEGSVGEALQELIEELVDIEEYVLAGKPIPRARRYRYRVNKQHFVSHTPELTREQILERAGLVPVNQYRLSEKRRHGPPIEIKPRQIVDLRRGEIERFIAQHCEVQDGLGTDRREFDLPAEDVVFLDSLDLRWEAVGDGGSLWIIIYGVTLPPGYSVSVTDVAIQITPGYPTSHLDMAYYSPAIARADGRAIPNADSKQPLDGKSWQRWSRHRLGASAWKPGIDNLESHFEFMQQWLAREIAP
jgi:Prokaryotic E2 family E/Multiubiquitin